MPPYDDLRSRIAQGWTAMLLAFVCMFLGDLVKSAITNDFSKWATDPGPLGLRVVSVVMTIYIVVPMLVRNVRARWYRWVAVAQAAVIGMFILAHQVAHALNGSRPFDINHIFDFTHHVLAIWVIVLSVRWAQQDVELPALGTGRMATAR